MEKEKTKEVEVIGCPSPFEFLVGFWVLLQVGVFILTLLFALSDRGHEYPGRACKPPFSRFTTYVAPSARLACFLAVDATPEEIPEAFK